MRTKIITPPASEPLSLAEAKLHLRVSHNDEDDLISSLIIAARQECERLTGRQLITATWEAYWDGWPDEYLYAPYPPLQSVTWIKYLDSNGTEQTWAVDQYRVDNISEPARIGLAYGAQWPELYPVANAVIIRYQAGYGDATAVPEPLKQWLRLRIGDYYENRQQVALDERRATLAVARNFAFDGLLANWRIG